MDYGSLRIEPGSLWIMDYFETLQSTEFTLILVLDWLPLNVTRLTEHRRERRPWTPLRPLPLPSV